ncbi:MAG: 50S ribosomal protein L23 [Bacteroidetes bacterium]|nr:50S ribosomal protein L23 [Bacteroidota bacterium]MCY4204965.1 50S ribosomal protein L23 [Bacteroidota bacterium]
MSRQVLIRPLVTEKLSAQMEEGHYAFIVDPKANKIEIKQAIQHRFPAVQIKEVRTINVRGKQRRQMTRQGVRFGRTASYKKAIVTLLPGSEQIDFFESI